MSELIKRVLSYPLGVVLVAYHAADAVFGPVLKPALAWLASLDIFVRLGRAIAKLPPYALLVLLAVPFIAIEPFKFVGLYWIAEGRIVAGALTLAVAYLLSFFICERIFHVGREKLLTIGWFARGYRFVVAVRTQALDWIRSTAAWRWAASIATNVRARIMRLTNA